MIGAGAGGAPDVRYLDVNTTVLKANFAALPTNFFGGARVALGDVTSDGIADYIVAAGPGGGPDVRVFDGVSQTLIREFFAYPLSFTGGVWVAAGDVFHNGYADIVTGADAGGSPDVRVFDGKTGALVREFFAYSANFTGGVRVAVADVNGDGYADIITAAGPGGGPSIRVFDGKTGAQFSGPLGDMYAYAANFTGGVYVAAGDITGD